MKKQIITMIMLFFAITANAVITRSEAIDLVLNQILVDEVGSIDVYASYGLMEHDDSLFVYTGRTVSIPYLQNWVFFSNDYPMALWSHPCRYIFVNYEDGEHSIMDETCLPKDLKIDFEKISQITVDIERSPDLQNPPSSTRLDREENPNLHAIIISGDHIHDTDEIAFFNDVSSIYCTLLQYGFQ